MVKFRQPYDENYNPAEFATDVGYDPSKPDAALEASATQQSFADECDVNIIMARWAKTGIMPQGSRQSQFGDFTGAEDYQSAMNAVIAAQNAFDALPANIRKRFENDPAQLLAFINDVNNRDEAISLGLIESSSTGAATAPEAPAQAGDTPSAT